MARCFFYIAFLMMPLLIQAQQQPEWFPVGAEWHYTFNSSVTPPSYSSFTTIKIADTATKNGVPCKELNYMHDQDNDCHGSGAGKYVYAQNNQIYFYNKVIDSFQLLYDFGAKPGDTWKIANLRRDTTMAKSQYNNIIFQVDSVDTTSINGNDLKVIYLHDTLAQKVGSIGQIGQIQVTQYIGSSSTFFPWSTTIKVEDCAGDFYGPFRCYEAPNFGFYKAPNFSGPCDTVITSLREPPSPSNPKVSISPHPVTHTSTIQLSTSKSRKGNDVTCTIYDPLGRKMDKVTPSSSTSDRVQFQINATSWEAGVYIYRISSTMGQLKTGKVVVQ